MVNSPVAPLVIGWREYVHLPTLGLFDVKAKTDTGARTTALHAHNVALRVEGGEQIVEFTTTPALGTDPVRCKVPALGYREVRNTSGIPEMRIVVRTKLTIARRTWLIDVTLANRSDMKFPLILGRTAIRGHNTLVDPKRSFLVSQDPRRAAGKETFQL